MRGNTLANIRAMLKAEIGNFAGTNTSADSELNILLSNKQQWLANEYAWSFLERRWDVAAPANGQYIALPAADDLGDSVAINFVRMPEVFVYYNQKYTELDYGISAAEYNAQDITIGQQSDPIQRWRLAANPDEAHNPNFFEVWPVPVTAQKIRFVGQRVPLVLAVDADKADFEDMLLVLLVAADKLMRYKQADAQAMTQKAQRMLQQQRQNFPTPDRKRSLCDGVSDGSGPRSGIKLVAIH